MATGEEKRDSNELTFEEARPFLLEKDDEEAMLGDPPPSPSSPMMTAQPGLSNKFWFAVAGNCIATVGIVFVNKHIFSDSSLRHAQVAFAAFHLAVTALLLYVLSRPRIAWFEAKKVDTLLILPLALAMIFNVVLPNASLANSSIQFYQVAKVLQTPVVALLNYALCQTKISSQAAMTLVPLCVGVAVVSYFDTLPTAEVRETTFLGVFFALTGVLATGLYTVWIGKYLRVLECSSQQLLLNQAPVSVMVMLYIIPFSDDVTVWGKVNLNSWVLIVLSGCFACAIHLSQFFIIKEAGPVSSTVVGHFKNTSIVALAWLTSWKFPVMGSVVGILCAFGGMFAYSYVTHRQGRK